MLVRSKEMVFIKGRRLRVNPATGLTEAFEVQLVEGRKFPKHLVPADGSEKVEKIVKSAIPPGQASAPTKTGQPTKRELMAQLAAAGIKFKATLSAADLQALLDGEKAKVAPASTTAPPKKLTGEEGVGEQRTTADQDVI